jgi:DNA-binding response OmpR family regulator
MAGERILVVEDERADARGLEYGLAAEGYSVPLAEAGKQAPEWPATISLYRSDA